MQQSENHKKIKNKYSALTINENQNDQNKSKSGSNYDS